MCTGTASSYATSLTTTAARSRKSRRSSPIAAAARLRTPGLSVRSEAISCSPRAPSTVSTRPIALKTFIRIKGFSVVTSRRNSRSSSRRKSGLLKINTRAALTRARTGQASSAVIARTQVLQAHARARRNPSGHRLHANATRDGICCRGDAMQRPGASRTVGNVVAPESIRRGSADLAAPSCCPGSPSTSRAHRICGAGSEPRTGLGRYSAIFPQPAQVFDDRVSRVRGQPADPSGREVALPPRTSFIGDDYLGFGQQAPAPCWIQLSQLLTGILVQHPTAAPAFGATAQLQDQVWARNQQALQPPLLVHGRRHPVHQSLLGARLRLVWPAVDVSMRSGLLPAFSPTYQSRPEKRALPPAMPYRSTGF